MKTVCFSTAALLAALASPLLAQTGADTCATPDVIVGFGPFAFDNTTATTGLEGQNEGLCLDYNTTGIGRDVWFRWTANFTGNAEITLCGGTTMDTRLAAYAGTTCPVLGSALACNDDACALVSTIHFNVTSGNDYVLQLGVYPLVTTGQAGTFQINTYVQPAGDECSAPIALAGPGTYNFDLTIATTGFQGQTEPSCNVSGTTGIASDLWYSYTATTSGLVTVTTCGLITPQPSNDSKLAAYLGTGCPVSGSAVACNDDDAACATSGLNSTIQFAASCGQSFLIQVGRWPNAGNVIGQFSVTESGTPCTTTGTPYCFGDGTGTACPCGNNGSAGNGCASSVNANGANLTATGTASIASDSLVLLGSGMSNSSALYFQGTTQISNGFGDGLRCAGGTIRRLGTKTNVAGASQYPETGDQPVSIRGAVTSPGDRTYQVWYRNAAAFCTPATFNLTNGLLVTWQ